MLDKAHDLPSLTSTRTSSMFDRDGEGSHRSPFFVIHNSVAYVRSA
jgi:hypothetical protein